MNKSILKPVVLLILIISFYNLNAQGQETYHKSFDFKHAFGVAAGFSTAYGLTYRYWPGKFGGQITFAPLTTDYVSRISFGTTFLYEVAKKNSFRAFIYQGNHFYHRNYRDGNSFNSNSDVSYFNNGLGFGGELIADDHLSMSLMAGYAFYKNFDYLSITAEISFMFAF